jgi:hypothetical protein
MTIKQVGLLLGLIAAIHAMALHESTNTTASTATTTNTASTSNICSFNTLVPIPATKEHTYSLKAAGKTKYAFDDFVVVDPKSASRNDSFLDWVGKTGNFKDNFPKMLCRVADKSVLETVCKIGKAQIDAVFTQRFGLDIIFLCKVPKKAYGLGHQVSPQSRRSPSFILRTVEHLSRYPRIQRRSRCQKNHLN